MPTSSAPPTFYAIPGGGSLRGDAAASYLRMRADGLPAGGVDVWSRTYAEQAALRRLYELDKGPLAARPTPTAPHIKGVALDLQTTRGGRYTPSAAHLWLTAGGSGERPPALREKLRAHAYGWRRTVPSERWHFGYVPTADTRAPADLARRLQALGYRTVRDFQRAKGLTVDGEAGPQTWTALLLAAAVVVPAVEPEPPEVPVPTPIPPPTPQPAPTPQATIALGVANCQSYDGRRSEASYRARAGIYARKGWTVVAVCETTEDGRRWIRDELRALTGHKWRVATVGGRSVALLWDDTAWSWRPWRTRSFGTAFGHGVVVVPLVHRATGRGVDVGSIHTRPKSIATEAQKRADVAKARGLAKGWPMILAGDFALDAPPMPGWQRATPVVDTVKSDNGRNSRVDAAFIRGQIGVGESVKIDPDDLSDHYWWGVALTLGGSPL